MRFIVVFHCHVTLIQRYIDDLLINIDDLQSIWSSVITELHRFSLVYGRIYCLIILNGYISVQILRFYLFHRIIIIVVNNTWCFILPIINDGSVDKLLFSLIMIWTFTETLLMLWKRLYINSFLHVFWVMS